MSIDWEINIPWAMIGARFEAATPIALDRGAEHLRAVAVGRTPDASGHLRGEAGVTTTGAGFDSVSDVKYGGPYAAFQNRGMRADGSHVIRNRPAGGQTGFLTQSVADQREAILTIIRDTIVQLS